MMPMDLILQLFSLKGRKSRRCPHSPLRHRIGTGTLGIALLFATPAVAQLQTIPGSISTPYPTAVSIAIEWSFSGDDNGNGEVSVRYRPVSGESWLIGPQLRRIAAGSNGAFSWSNRHSGSLFDLNSNQAYQIELTLIDPDGGSSIQTVTALTRQIPKALNTTTVLPATPGTLSAVLASVQPGQIVLLQPGSYSGFSIDVSGQPEAPIVVRALPGAQINGELGIFLQHDVMLESLVVNGRIRFNGSDRVTIRRCVVNASPNQFDGDGIVSFLRSESAYIVDNVVLGTTQWTEAAMGASGANRGEGIVVTGPGHLIAHNRVSHFRDNISLMEDGSAVDQFSIDIYRNELSQAADDAIEADFCFHNCRIRENRVTNAFVAFSSQPGLGGPTYFIRNAAYNVAHVAFKLYRSSDGDVLLHNSVVKAGDALGLYPGVPVRNTFARNNLFLGGPGSVINGFANGSGRVIDFASLELAGASLNYNGYGSATSAFEGRLGPISFNSLAQLRALTTESEASAVSLADFQATVGQPNDPLQIYPQQDLRLQAAAAGVDGGQPMAGINDGFSGAAPDLGAYEFGVDLPVYGPRERLLIDGFE